MHSIHTPFNNVVILFFRINVLQKLFHDEIDQILINFIAFSMGHFVSNRMFYLYNIRM